MIYEVTELAMKSLTIAQVKALAALDRWNADKIVVHRDFPERFDGLSDTHPYYMIATIWRYKESTEKPIFTIGIGSDGSMNS